MTYYQGNLLRARWASFRDWRAGRRGQANARWGWLKAPQGRGPALWIQGFADRDDLRLAGGLLKALREKRLDLRMVLTYEREYPELVGQQFDGIKGVGYGFGPCDHPVALRRTLERLAPFRYLAVGAAPRPALARLLPEKGIPAVVMAAEAPAEVPAGLEAVYPRNDAQYAAWRDMAGGCVQEPVDFLTMLTVAQVEPNFRSLVGGGAELHLWWVEGLGAGEAEAWQAAWNRSPLGRRGVLFLGSEVPCGALPISRWQRNPIPAGTVVWVDEPHWRPALAVACQGVHLAGASRGTVWQALAGGQPMSLGPQQVLPRPERLPPDGVPVLGPPEAVLGHWEEILANPIVARERGDANRRAFWDERRLAQARLPEFLQRAFDW